MHTIFIDTEFSVLSQEARLLSLALVPENGNWFYAVFTDEDTTVLSTWHQENVVPHLPLSEEQLEALPPGKYVRGNQLEIVTALREFLSGFERIAMWADVPAYDWVLFCELFGGALRLPNNIHYMVRDLATLLEAKGYDVDTDRFALAYGNEDAAAGAKVRSSDGRLENLTPGPSPGERGESRVLRHNALGDALAGLRCWEKISER